MTVENFGGYGPDLTSRVPDDAYFKEGAVMVDLKFEAPRLHYTVLSRCIDAEGVLHQSLEIASVRRIRSDGVCVCVYDSSGPNAEMIRRDGPAKPKTAVIEAPTLLDQSSSTPGLMVVADLGQRWG